MTLLKLLAAAGSTAFLYGIWKIIELWKWPMSSPLRDLPGPKKENWFTGNIGEFLESLSSGLHEEWVKKYGKVLVFKAFMNMDRIYTVDPRALNHVLTHSVDYQKPPEARDGLSRLLGNGILITEGDKHKQQRRVMNPSFGPPSVRELTPIFYQKATQLRDIWKSQLSEDGKPQRIEVLSWLSRTTLDIIGLAGFNYHFNSLNVNAKPNELNRAFSTLFHIDAKIGLLMVLQAIFTPLRYIPTSRMRNEWRSKKTMLRIAEGLLRERKQMFINDDKGVAEKDFGDGSQAHDLLSVLVKANMDTDIPESQRMADEDVLAQVPTFLVAGHETTSVETMWCLYALAQYPEYQSRLREELSLISTDMPSMDDLQSLPFLDAVVRETLRVYPAVPGTSRVAMKDDLIPVGEPFMDRNGKVRTEIPIRKGETIFIPITAVNRYSEIWGQDAMEFNPDRWAKLPESATAIPGVWANMLTFLGGPRSCIGYRFALVEMKALLFTLIRAFEFELAVPVDVIEKRTMVVTRPYLTTDKDGPAQMPLLVKAHVPLF